ncbi:MAG: hypothetical protein ACXW00_00815 [Methylobacter sp.]
MYSGKNAVDYGYYLNKSTWTQFEFFCLLRGIDPRELEARLEEALRYEKRDKYPYFCDAQITDSRELNHVNIEKSFDRKKQRTDAKKIILSILKDIELFEPDIKLGTIPTTLINGDNYYNKGDFRDLALSKGMNVPEQLIGVLTGYVEQPKQKVTKPNAEPIGNNKTKSRLDNQVEKICETAARFGYELLKIPEGGKAAIKDECLKDASLFTDSSFKRSWLKANKLELIPHSR